MPELWKIFTNNSKIAKNIHKYIKVSMFISDRVIIYYIWK